MGGEMRSIFSLFVSYFAMFMTAAQNIQNTNVFDLLGKVVQKEVQAVKQPIDETLAYVGSSQCKHVKKLLGVSYEQLQGVDEPDLNGLTLVYRYKLLTEIINLKNAVEVLRRRPNDFTEELVLFAHGFTDDPTKESFSNISEAYLSNGHTHVVALDGSSLLQWLYLRSSTYVRFIGERMGRVLAAMVQHGQNPDKIHLVGHSLGAHIAGFAGKTFHEVTGSKIGRITGLDPAGPCFSHVDPDLRIKASDAKFVDIIHTDAGVYGIKDFVGHADYFPNSGALQPSCLLQTCSHSRAWRLYGASVWNPRLFPAKKCNSWDDFEEDRCSKEISYMGFGAKPTTGQFYLQTSGDYPFGLGEKGLNYKNRNGIVRNIQDTLFG